MAFSEQTKTAALRRSGYQCERTRRECPERHIGRHTASRGVLPSPSLHAEAGDRHPPGKIVASMAFIRGWRRLSIQELSSRRVGPILPC